MTPTQKGILSRLTKGQELFVAAGTVRRPTAACLDNNKQKAISMEIIMELERLGYLQHVEEKSKGLVGVYTISAKGKRMLEEAG